MMMCSVRLVQWRISRWMGWSMIGGVDEHRRHAERVRHLEFAACPRTSRPRCGDAMTRIIGSKAAAVGLGRSRTKRCRRCLEKIENAELRRHPLGVRARAIGEDQLAAGQALDAPAGGASGTTERSMSWT